MISVTDNDLRTTANGGSVENANGFDIVFYSAADCSSQLDHQIEKYDPVTGEYIAWVRIPTLPATSDHGIHMYYGNSSVGSDPSSTGTWNANYLGVWHMAEDPSAGGAPITDYTAGTNDGTPNGGMTSGDLVTAQIGDGLDFDGNNDYINIGDILIDGLTQITVEAWIRPTALPSKGSPSGHNSNEGAIVHKSGNSDDNLGVTVATGGMAFYIDDGGNNTPVAAAPSTGAWMFVACTWDNSTMIIYQDGASAATMGSVTGTFVNNSNALRFGGVHGNAGGNPHEFTGIIDEIKISNIAHSADWVLTEYNNQNSPSTFYTVSTELNASDLCATLPIELLDFEARKSGISNVDIQWQTASEINNNYFTVQRSVDGLNWEDIDRIEGAGNSSVQIAYKTIDPSPYPDLSYYRLRQTDFDGTVSYSMVRSVNFLNELGQIQVFPNPVGNELTVYLKKGEIESIRLFNVLGQDVTARIIISNVGSNKLILDLSALEAGSYFLRSNSRSSSIIKR